MSPHHQARHGRFTPMQTLHMGALGHVLSGRDQETGLPALAFEFAQQQLNAMDQGWFIARTLKPPRTVQAPAIIEVQSTPRPLVAVAWSPAHLGIAEDGMPTRLSDLVTWFGGLQHAGEEVGIGHVLAALDRLEPGSMAGTVVLDGAPRAGTATPPSCQAVSAPAPPATEVAVQPAPVIPPTKALPQAELADAIAKWQAAGRRPAAKSPSDPSPRERARRAKHDGATSRVRAKTHVLLIAVGAAAAVALACLTWFVLRSQEPMASLHPRFPVAPPAAPQKPAPAAPAAAPAAAPSANEAPAEDGAAENAEPGNEAASPAAEVVLTTHPGGADVCDTKSAKLLGKTPLSMPANHFHRGRRLLLTAQGHAALEVRWPPRKLYRLAPLGPDEPQALSPCAF